MSILEIPQTLFGDSLCEKDTGSDILCKKCIDRNNRVVVGIES